MFWCVKVESSGAEDCHVSEPKPHRVLELEAIHIPKTAGSSFLRLLSAWFGETGLLLDYPSRRDAVSEATVAAYGHFPVFRYPAKARICWVRDPAMRLISEFFFFRARAPMPEESEIRHAVWAGEMTLVEFVEHPQMRNNMTQHYLAGATLEDFQFVGISEHFLPESYRLATVLGKPPYRMESAENQNAHPEYEQFKRHSLTPELLAAIRSIHREDAEFYNAAAARSLGWWNEHQPAA